MSNLEFEEEQTSQYGNQLDFKDEEKPKEEASAAPDIDGIDDDIEIPEEDQQLNLFGEEEKPKKKTKKKNAPKKAKEEDKVGTEYTVYYAGHQVNVPEDKMTLEKLRQYLESDFPELSKERTTMTLDKEKKHVIPVVNGAKKG